MSSTSSPTPKFFYPTMNDSQTVLTVVVVVAATPRDIVNDSRPRNSAFFFLLACPAESANLVPVLVMANGEHDDDNCSRAYFMMICRTKPLALFSHAIFNALKKMLVLYIQLNF